MRYWLMKSEPDVVGIDHVLAMPKQTVDWWGVRNYQARNFMRDQMSVGDRFSSTTRTAPSRASPGWRKWRSAPIPTRTQFDPKSPYFDPKSSPENPRWVNVDVRVTRKTRLVSLAELRAHPELAHMRVLARGNRLSITPVDPAEWKFITEVLMK